MVEISTVIVPPLLLLGGNLTHQPLRLLTPAALTTEDDSSPPPSTTSAGGSVGFGDDWWLRVIEEDLLRLRMEDGATSDLTGAGGGLWTGSFVPPPPRPLFLEETAAPDGLTTCDLCTWAWRGRNGNAFSLDQAIEAPGELSWVFTLVIVSLISAVIGAIVMIIVLHCKSRIKSAGLNDSERTLGQNNSNSLPHHRRPPIDLPLPLDDTSDKEILPLPPNTYHLDEVRLQRHNHLHHQHHHHRDNEHSVTSLHHHNNNQLHHHHQLAYSGVWSWLAKRCSATPSQMVLQQSQQVTGVGGVGGGGRHHHHPSNHRTAAAENHYTHMEEAVTAPTAAAMTTSPGGTAEDTGSAIYAELDREDEISGLEEMGKKGGESSPAYQNSGYVSTDADLLTASTPSSAYYSDLSVNGGVTAPLSPTTVTLSPQQQQQQQQQERAYEVVGLATMMMPVWDGAERRLASISETIHVPSDYV